MPGSGGCRKIRWGREGSRKRGGDRVIYTHQLTSGAVVAIPIEGKGATENIPAHTRREIAKARAMPLTAQELSERDSKHDIGAELLESIRQIKACNVDKVPFVKMTLAVEALPSWHVAGAVRRQARRVQAHTARVGARAASAVRCGESAAQDRCDAAGCRARGLWLTRGFRLQQSINRITKARLHGGLFRVWRSPKFPRLAGLSPS